MSSIVDNTELSTLRRIFWPVKSSEIHHFFAITFLIFFALFNQNILRILKDTLLISEVSPEVTSFVKVWCVTPAAGLFILIYAKMINHFSFTKTYYILITAFTSFFAFFGFVIFPNINTFHPDPANIKTLMQANPYLQWYIALLGNWSYVILYVLSELWPNIFYILMCWQIANQITSSEQARRFYTFMVFIANSSVVLVGFVMKGIARGESFLFNYCSGKSHTESMVQISMSMVCVGSIIMLLIIKSISKHNSLSASPLKKQNKMGLLDSMKYIVQSRYLWLMLICSASFGLTMNLVEAVWKSKINELYPSMDGYAEYFSNTIMWTGVMIMLITLVGNSLMRFCGWLTTAMMTPVIILITGTIFFILVVFETKIHSLFNIIYLAPPLALAVSVGMIQNVLAKGSKYSVWDSCREMLYIPLDQELKTKGKAAVDVVSSKIGKSMSSVVQSILFTIFPMATYNSIAPVMMIVFIIFMIAWIAALKEVSKDYTSLLNNENIKS